jgi:hypothetical protein
MSGNPYAGVAAVERYLSVERYRESHQAAALTHLLTDGEPDTPNRRRARVRRARVRVR